MVLDFHASHISVKPEKHLKGNGDGALSVDLITSGLSVSPTFLNNSLHFFTPDHLGLLMLVVFKFFIVVDLILLLPKFHSLCIATSQLQFKPFFDYKITIGLFVYPVSLNYFIIVFLLLFL